MKEILLKPTSPKVVTILLLINLSGLIAFYTIDFSFDQHIDQKAPYALFILTSFYFLGWLWYAMAKRPYNYTQ